jgi:hypothetical protein
MADTSLADGEDLFLVIVDVHRGLAARLDEVLDLEAVSGGVLDTPNEGELLSAPILDGVRIGVSIHRPIVRGFGPLDSHPRRCVQQYTRGTLFPEEPLDVRAEKLLDLTSQGPVVRPL